MPLTSDAETSLTVPTGRSAALRLKSTNAPMRQGFQVTDCLCLFRQHVARALLFVALYVAGAELGHWLTFPGQRATFWPPTGILLAALVLTKVRYWREVAGLSLLAYSISEVVIRGQAPAMALALWVPNTLAVLVGARIVRRFVTYPFRCDTIREILGITLIAAPLASVVSATLGAFVLASADSAVSFGQNWRGLWICDALSIIIFTPLMLSLAPRHGKWSGTHAYGEWFEGCLAFLSLIAATHVVYGPNQHSLAFIVFPILVWITLRLGMRKVCIANFIRAGIAIWHTAQGTGPFSGSGTPADQLLQLQVFLSFSSASFLVLAAVVSERRRFTLMIQESETRYRDLLDNMDALVHSVDAQGKILYVNRAWLTTLGYDASQLGSLTIFDVIHPADSQRFREQLQQLIEGEDLEQHEFRLLTSSGATLIVEGRSNCRRIEGQPLATRSIFRDITSRRQHESQLDSYRQQLEAANRQLMELATTDSLTGLHNRRAFQERLASEVERAQRYEHYVSLILIDVDHFKQFNDSFGHQVGDEVLQRVARTLQRVARGSDFVARFGGEEFTVILPYTDSAGAVIFAERLRAAIEAEPCPQRQITASLGIATLAPGYNVDGDDESTSLIRSADEALYYSKAMGRNQVNHAAHLQVELV